MTHTITSNNGNLWHWCNGEGRLITQTGWYMLYTKGQSNIHMCSKCQAKFRMTNLFRHLKKVSIYRGQDSQWGIVI